MGGPAPDLAGEAYVSLETFRRDGRGVATPVWIAGSDPYYVFSAATAGKVKRLRNTARIRLAPCGAGGTLRGPWRAGRARVVDDPAAVARAYVALRAKYGWRMRLTDILSRLTGRYHRRAIIEITLDGA